MGLAARPEQLDVHPRQPNGGEGRSSVRSGLEFIVCSLTDALGVLKDDIALAGQGCHVFMFSTFEPYLYNSNLIFS